MGEKSFTPWQDAWPRVSPDVYIAPGCHIIGEVKIAPGSSIWFNCVLRGDVAPIHIGSNTNIQDGCILHGAEIPEVTPVKVGDNVTVGHNAILHACTIGDDAFIGMGAIILSRAVIGKGALVAAGCLVPEDAIIPPEAVVMGVPAKIVRQVSEAERQRFREIALAYRDRAAQYKKTTRG